MLNSKAQVNPTLQWVLSIALATSCMMLGQKSAQANCAGFGRSPETVNLEVQERVNQLKENTNEFFGQKMIASFTNAQQPTGKLPRITLTPAFDRFSGPDKRQILRTLQLDGSTYEVYAADGRLVSAQYDGCTRTDLLTERDRYSWYLNRPPVPMPTALLQEALRNAGKPRWRAVQAHLSVAEERRVRTQFWETVGYDKANKGWWIAWVPEGGYFEVTVVNANDAAGLKSFLAKASQQYRYVVLAKDGTPLSDTRYTRGNPWQWLLGQTAVPKGWQVRPCEGEAPFLCVLRQGRQVGTIELQRWDYDKLTNLQKQFTELGLTPGLITYDNATDKAKVLTALKAEIARYYQTIKTDRTRTLGKPYQVQTLTPTEVKVGNLPGLSYGWKGIDKTGKVQEKSVSYMAFDGSKSLYVMVTSFDAAAETGSFQDLASLEQFEPTLSAIVSNLKLPHPDW